MLDSDLSYQFKLLQSIRNFFNEKGFTDVLTPPMVANPGYEAHIHPFRVVRAINGEDTKQYLHTSPEFWMKKLLSDGFEKIYTMSYCFRDDIDSPHHRNQFIMLEWYRANAHYTQIMDDTENLLTYCLQDLKKRHVPLVQEKLKIERMTVQEIFQEVLNIDILLFLQKEDLRELIAKDFKDVPLPSKKQNLLWEDYFFLLFLNKIEPTFVKRDALLLYEFPRDLSALSTLKESDPRVCERFEIYIKGVELCNCFNELRDIKIQKQRFLEQKEIKKKLYGYELPEPAILFNSLQKGFPPSAGIALGVERLLLALAKVKNPFFT